MILDTNALSAFADADHKLLARLPSDRPWALPVVVIGEYRFGLLGSREGEARERWLQDLIRTVRVLAVTETTAGFYAAVRHELKQQRRSIPPNDSWIAALALEHRLPVLTRDAHFENIPEVQPVGW
ncbi:MAG: PIN domain-containing protein [Verrucomicrobia bacterium]|jgi:tRNA(fMet)-specific endonuclease VapC|nr:PIN domain-containing protein [Verrucomicrobiota bacterium]MDA1005033.1 PIN domain-containing protein [Verrucomicrobiota bacterium]